MHPGEERLPLSRLVFYALPSLGLSFSFFLTSLYLMKFATDVLLIAPGVMGVLFGLSKVWDAISDPIAGHLSDRTHSRLGRRRSWILASALPLAGSFVMLWSAPEGLSPALTVVWMGVAVFAFFTATTIFSVPHESLGAELSLGHHDRTRVFAVRFAVATVGTLLAALGGLTLLLRSEAPRASARELSLAAGAITALLIVLSVRNVAERPEHQGRGAASLGGAFRDVLANPHARTLLLVFGIESFGSATLASLIVYVTEYVIGARDLTPIFLVFYTVPALLFVPVALRLSRTLGKKRTWLLSMATLTLAFGGLFFVGEGDVTLVCTLGVIAGVGSACGQVVGPSIQADVIDYDEWRTGERKEGAYFAVWNFVRKFAFGLPPILIGFVLQAVGYEPNVPQSEETKVALRALFGLVPGVCYLVGTLLFLRFGLDEAAHARLRKALDARPPR